jgi:autotransporter-associated beta strand protein
VASDGGVIKAGDGFMNLAANNTYAGPTVLNAGELEIGGYQPQSDVTVTGGQLDPNGTLGKVTATGGVVSPGGWDTSHPSAKDFVLGAGTLSFDAYGPNESDKITVVGGVNLTGGSFDPEYVVGQQVGYHPVVGTTFTVIDNDGTDAVVGTFNGYPEGHTFVMAGHVFKITYTGGDGNDVVLQDMGALPQNYAAGADAGGGPLATVYNPDGSPKATVTAFEADFAGGVRTAVADVTGDGVADLIAGAGPGRVAEVRIYDGANGQLVRGVQPFGDFAGGVFVAAGDFDNDGLADVVITPDQSGGPRVTVLSGKDGAVLANFFGIDDANFRGGARAAIGDVNGDGRADLVVSAGFGGGPRIAVFDGASLAGTPTRLVSDFFAFEPALRNGAYVASGDLNGDGYSDLIFGGGPGGGPRVLALDAHETLGGTPAVLANFFAGNVDNRGGVRVAAKNLDGDAKADLVMGDGPGAGSRVTSYLGSAFANGSAPVNSALDAFPGFLGGVFVG